MLTSVATVILARIGALWRWFAADPVRMVIIGLIALCALLAARLAAIDGDRDAWRERSRDYEAASRSVKAADRRADGTARDVAKSMKGTIDAGNERAADAANGSDDPLRGAFDSLRAEAARSGDQAAR